MREEFNKATQTSTREEYEKKLVNKQSIADYIDTYAVTNSFLRVNDDDSGVPMHLLFDKGVPLALNAVGHI